MPGYSAVSRAREFPADVTTSIKNESALTAISSKSGDAKSGDSVFGIVGIFVAVSILVAGIYLALVYLL